MKDYYRRQDIRKAIIDFTHAGNGKSVREGAFYNSRAGILQRYMSREDSEKSQPIVFDSIIDIERALRESATAFYTSYSRYLQPEKLSKPMGRDLVWLIRAETGGLNFTKEITSIIVQLLEGQGFPEPWVKYSGVLGFDIVLPLEAMLDAVSPSDSNGFDEFQKELTIRMADDINARVSFSADHTGSKVVIRSGSNICLLSELGWRRGLLLAPMSLHPSSGLVSVPVKPSKVEDFSVMDASPESVRPFSWRVPPATSWIKEVPNLTIQPVSKSIAVA